MAGTSPSCEGLDGETEVVGREGLLQQCVLEVGWGQVVQVQEILS